MGSLFLGALLLGVIALAAFIWLVVLAFKQHVGWGLALLLFSPISATIYAIKYWPQVKKPFLLHVTAMVASIGLAFYAFAAAGGMQVIQAAYQVHEGIQKQTLTEEQAKDFMKSGLEFMEKTAETEEQRQQIAVIRKGFEQPESGSGKDAQHQASRDLEELLGLDDSQHRPEGIEPETGARRQEAPVPGRVASVPAHGSQGPGHKVISPAEAKHYIGSRVLLTGMNDVPQECRLIGVHRDTLEFERRFGYGSISFHYKIKNIESLTVLPD